jgi:hypothetical protein
MAKKRRMTKQQEFEVMKLVLDKFLWLGFIVMGWGLVVILRDAVLTPGLWYIGAGAVLLVLFALIIIKEYEIV